MVVPNLLIARLVAVLFALAAITPVMADAQSLADACIARMANQVESGQTVIDNAAANAISRIETLDAQDARPSKLVAASRAGQKTVTKAAERTRQAIRAEARRCVISLSRQDADQSLIDNVLAASQSAQADVTESAVAAHLLVNTALDVALADEAVSS